VHDSLQRCYVVHDTHNITVSENVAWNATGHCFMLEDGSELYNQITANVGILTKPPKARPFPNSESLSFAPSCIDVVFKQFVLVTPTTPCKAGLFFYLLKVSHAPMSDPCLTFTKNVTMSAFSPTSYGTSVRYIHSLTIKDKSPNASDQGRVLHLLTSHASDPHAQFASSVRL
jgi:hypothetical protein